jgi:D-cysteine desulfhydrase
MEPVLLALDFPTPLRRLPAVSSQHVEVWLKDDGAIHPLYGGNKVRKLVELFRGARARGARRILTFGPGGSHHVLATALFARAHGLECAAVLLPQPESVEAIDTLRAALGAGLHAIPAPTPLSIPGALSRAYEMGDVIVPPGGASTEGASAYAAGFSELLAQFAALGEPAPDCIVLALGTGGTAAGLLAGAALNHVATTINAVSVVRNPLARFSVSELAARVMSRAGVRPERALLRSQLSIDRRQLGRGYGHRTPEGSAATARGAELGLVLDGTYTAKAFARVLEMASNAKSVPRERPLRIVYWHTLSAAPLTPLLERAPARDELSRDLRRLFKRV